MKTKDGHETIFINVEYDDVNAKTYEGISVRPLGGRKKVFNSNYPTFDYCCAIVYIRQTVKHDDAIVMCGSSIDHFEMDGGELDTNPQTEMLQIAKDYLILKNIVPYSKSKVK